jgi:hypothetical protein
LEKSVKESEEKTAEGSVKSEEIAETTTEEGEDKSVHAID